MISGVLSYVVMLLIGLALLGLFGNISQYYTIFGIVLLGIFIWWVIRRMGVIPAY
jgi:hypothetical protein